MDTTMESGRNQSLLCIICKNIYKDPSTLLCGHTFCKKCLMKFIKKQQKSLLCPVANCNRLTKVTNPTKKVEDWVKEVQPSFLIRGLLNEFEFRNAVHRGDNPCFTCLQNKEKSSASQYCSECDAALCNKCVKTIHSVSANANHNRSDLGGITKVTRKRQVACKTHKTIVKYCCKDCHKTVCHDCCILHHRKCDNVVTIESMMPEMKSLLKDRKDMYTEQVEKIEPCMKTMKTRITEIRDKKAQTLAQIKKASQTAISIIQRKEKQLIDELEDITGKQIENLEGQLNSGEIDIQMYQQHCEFIDQALEAESEMDIYDMYRSEAIIKVSDTDAQSKVTYEKDEVTFVEEFDQQPRVSDIKLGRLRVMKKKTGFENLDKCQENKSTPVLSGIKRTCDVTPGSSDVRGLIFNDDEKEADSKRSGRCTLVQTIEFKTRRDTVNPDLTDVKVLTVNNIETVVVTDSTNNSLRSFYIKDKKQCRSSLPLRSKPWTMTKLTHDQVLVSCYGTNLIVRVRVTPDLSQLSSIDTEKQYPSITALSGKTLVAGCGNPPSLDILNLRGEVRRTIKTPKGLFAWPDFLTTTRKGNILVSSGVSKSVMCLTQEGDVIFNISLTSSLSQPRGVAITTTGDILVADKDNNKIVQLKPTGDFVRELITSNDGIRRPNGICLHEGKLYVTQTSEPVKVFRIK